MSEEYKNARYEAEKKKTIVITMVVIILLAQTYLFGAMMAVSKNTLDNISKMSENKIEFYETMIIDLVRPQQRMMLSSVRQSWMQYMEINPDTELIEKTNGKYVYRNDSGDKLLFDNRTMVKIKSDNNCYIIKDSRSGKLLMKNARPQWNTETVIDVINVVASSSKAFGENGEVVIYDVYTGEILVDNSKSTYITKEVLGKDMKRNILLYKNHPLNKNPESFYRLTEKLMGKSNTQRESQLTSLFDESKQMDDKDINNFHKYPFGQYDREFVEKIILPYETMGVDGMDMQLGIAIRSQEQEIFSAFKAVDNDFKSLISEEEKESDIASLIPMISSLLSIFITFLSIYTLRFSFNQCTLYEKNKNKEKRL